MSESEVVEQRRQGTQVRVPVRLSSRIVRVTASNGGVMTGPGTNTYLVGDPSDNVWTVIDPGPDDPAHLRAIVDAAPGRIERIVVTHTHIDHSPGAGPLRALTGAPVYGMRAAFPERQDASFAPERELRDGERLPVGAGTTLRVLHTPGHASNHLCFLLEEEETLFTGDHVMQGSTVVVNPPDGDMSAYLASLESLLEEGITWFAPGHGTMMSDPDEVIRKLIRHRMVRESKVVTALRRLGRGTLDELVVPVYDDVPETRHGIAKRSLEAHLQKLQHDGVAAVDGDVWRPVDR